MQHILIAQPTTGSVATGMAGHPMEPGRTASADGIPWTCRAVSMANVLSVDSDMGFAASTIQREFALDRPVVAPACPRRLRAWERLRGHAGENHARALADFPAERPR